MWNHMNLHIWNICTNIKDVNTKHMHYKRKQDQSDSWKSCLFPKLFFFNPVSRIFCYEYICEFKCVYSNVPIHWYECPISNIHCHSDAYRRTDANKIQIRYIEF